MMAGFSSPLAGIVDEFQRDILTDRPKLIFGFPADPSESAYTDFREWAQ